ncbi:GMP/IMP nucleotidase [Catenovulum sp. SX2]|uniref:GMP/IMP nucleotidase n=1 Tax=Catenovulum sp. SX2 TaxID=3398614 RepID=UPI003F84165B
MTLQWQDIDTVLLDMDGTLLDLHFDNYFWLQHLPKRYAQIFNVDVLSIENRLHQMYAEMQGKLQWYCFDWWAQQLQVDIVELKQEITHLIEIRPSVTEFLQSLQQSHCRVILLTNSHPAGMQLKFDKTGIDRYFDEIVSSHDYGFCKEQQEFWQAAERHLKFDKRRCLFIDDSLPVLTAAKKFGIAFNIAVENPDSKKPANSFSDFESVSDFEQLTRKLSDIASRPNTF